MATSLSDHTCLEKFHSERDIVITAKQEITPEDVQELLQLEMRGSSTVQPWIMMCA